MPAGLHPVVITEVKDLGEQPDKFNPGKMRRTVIAVFKNAAGQQADRFYTPSMHEKSTLRKDLNGAFSGDIPERFFGDMEELVGLQCQILDYLPAQAFQNPC